MSEEESKAVELMAVFYGPDREASWKAWDELKRRYWDRLVGFLFAKLRDQREGYHLAEDSAADAFMTLVDTRQENRNRYDSTQGSFWSWFTKVALNRAWSALRKRRKEGQGGPEEPPEYDHDSPPDEQMAVEQLKTDLQTAIEMLDAKRREVLKLAVAGNSHAEIAHLLNMEAGTSGGRLCEAREAVRRYLESRGHDLPPARRRKKKPRGGD